MSESILRKPIVRERTGLANSTLYLLMARGEFPRPINLGERSVGWLESEVNAWIQKRIRASRGLTANVA